MQPLELLHDIHGVLNYHGKSGISHYPQNEGIFRFLHFLAELREGIHTPQAHKMPVENAVSKASMDFNQATVTLADIAGEVAQCQACNLAESRLATRAGLGGGRVLLLIVGDWLTGDPDVAIPEEVQFGIEEDRMLFRMLAAINLQAEQTFITNAVKCVVPESTHPLAENARICLSFLYRQIALLAPECICTMGMMATRALLGFPQPLSQLRGRFHSFQADNGRKIPLMASYHPTYLLQNTEMKKAAWLDLQAIGRLLKTLS